MILPYFALACLLGLAAAANEYCALCSDHVMCKYPSDTPGKACKNYQKPTMSSSDKELIVRLHNEYRNKVALGQETRGKNNVAQPSASNMRKMSWDDEIATYAQRWADQCTFDHDTCHTTKDKTISGQNLLLGGLAPNQTTPDWKEAVKLWYEEVTARDGSLNTKPFTADSTFMDVGHYTQLTWADTYAVGCAYSTYTAGSGTTVDTQLVVCNYKPSGNFEGEVQYAGGQPASNCPTGTQKDSTYPGLCASSSQATAKAAVSSLASVKTASKSPTKTKKSVDSKKKTKATSKAHKKRSSKAHKKTRRSQKHKDVKKHAAKKH